MRPINLPSSNFQLEKKSSLISSAPEALEIAVHGLLPRGHSAENASMEASNPHGQINHAITVSRTIYISTSMVCLIILSFMLGSRSKRLGDLRSITFIRVLGILMYALGIGFVYSAAIVVAGLGLVNPKLCHGAVNLCLAWYIAGKMIMYLFLVERAHSLRAPFKRRSHDWVWMGSSFLMLSGFAIIAIIAFLNPMSQFTASDGNCYIGLPAKVTIPLLTYDVFVNIVLTALFVYLLFPVLSFIRGTSPISIGAQFLELFSPSFAKNKASHTNPEERHVATLASAKKIEKLLRKSLVGAILMFVPTVTNLGVLTALKGHEKGWLCLTLCTADATGAVCIAHWLTSDATEGDEKRQSAVLPILKPGAESSGITVQTDIEISRHSKEPEAVEKRSFV